MMCSSFPPPPHVGTRWALLLAACLLACSVSHVEGQSGPAQLYMRSISLYTTHEWFLSSPEIYFQCEGEPQRMLTGVLQAHKMYNFTAHESFQPLTELDVPKCKRCGLFEKDVFTEDDVFDRFELCPLDFSEPPEGTLLWEAPGQMNITFFCKDCNTRNTYAGGEIFTPPTSSNATSLLIYSVALGAALVISSIVVCVVLWYRGEKFPFFGGRSNDDAKFMEMFDDEEDDFLAGGSDLDLDFENDLEMAGQPSGRGGNGVHVDAKND